MAPSSALIRLEEIDLDEFIARYYNPAPGAHTCMVGPNGVGKTTVGMQLLAKSVELYPETTGVALVMKNHKGPKSRGRRGTGDVTVERLVRQHGARVIRRWPPPMLWPWQRKPAYWALWPTHTGEPDQDNPAHEAIMRRAIIAMYNDGDSWVFADEAAGLTEDLNQEDALKQTLQRGRGMNAAMILATQRPRFVPRAMFSESKHFFLWKMADLAEYERVREIGGGQLTKQQIIDVLQSLSKHQCLYLYPDEEIACILV